MTNSEGKHTVDFKREVFFCSSLMAAPKFLSINLDELINILLF
jgi:hypothetical protein